MGVIIAGSICCISASFYILIANRPTTLITSCMNEDEKIGGKKVATKRPLIHCNTFQLAVVNILVYY